MNDPAITLSRLQACPFCERVVVKLDELGLDYRSRFVEPMHSDRDIVKRIAGTRTVPVIVDERTGVTMAESANIVEYLDRTYGESTGRAPTRSVPRNRPKTSHDPRRSSSTTSGPSSTPGWQASGPTFRTTTPSNRPSNRSPDCRR